MYDTAQFVFGCFVLWVNQCLSEGATHGITVCVRLFFLASVPVWFGPVFFADLTKAQLGYPQV